LRNGRGQRDVHPAILEIRRRASHRNDNREGLFA
jgi:hypothetical protein